MAYVGRVRVRVLLEQSKENAMESTTKTPENPRTKPDCTLKTHNHARPLLAR